MARVIILIDEYADFTEDQKEVIANEFLSGFPGIYDDNQLQRKDRELKTRARSRRVVEAYTNNEFSDLDNTIVESCLSDIRDAANRADITDRDYMMVCLRAKKLTYAQIAKVMDLSESTCFESLKIAQEAILDHPQFDHAGAAYG